MAQQTTDYKMFKLMGGNRRISKRRVDTIGRSMALHPEIFKIRPILVNEKFEIIDGQHRFNAAKKLGIPVWYEIAEGIGHDEALQLNQNQANWTLIDYARSYAHAGLQDYKDYLKVLENHPGFPTHIIMQYIGGNKKNNASEFRAGQFKATTIVIGEVYLDYLKDVAQYETKAKLQTAARALFKVFQTEGYDHDRLLSKFAIAPQGLFKPYGTMQEVLRSVEDIYNWKQQRDILRFYV
jgi:hypothetical protein